MNINWDEYKLGSISKFKNGVNFSASSMGSGTPLINVKDITNRGFLISENLDKVDITVKDDYYARDGDIFFVRSSVKRQGIADVNVFKEITIPSVHCGFVIRCRLNLNLAFPLFCYYYFKNPNFREYIRGFSSGTAIINISQESLKFIKIYLPPLPTQKKIAKILSNYDDLIENNLKRIKLLEEFTRLTYEEWFQHFRINGKKLEIDPNTGLPSGWLKKKFGDVYNINNGYAFKSGDYANHGVPILRTRDYSKTKWIKIDQPIYISEELSKKYTKYYVQEYDLMLIMVGASIGDYGIVLPNDMGLLQNQNQWAIRVNNGFEKYIFYKLLMMEDLIKNLLTRKTGAARDFFRASFLKELDILLPDEDTVTLLNKIVKPAFEEINNLQHQNQLLKESQDILLPRLMTGLINTDDMEIAV